MNGKIMIFLLILALLFVLVYCKKRGGGTARKGGNTKKTGSVKKSGNVRKYGHKNATRKVFNKGKKIPGKNPQKYRKDAYNNVIKFKDYGKNIKTGWHIDHIQPKSKNGSDNIKNLQPLQSRKNMQLGNKIYKKHV